MNILQYQMIELGETVRKALKRLHGIECELVLSVERTRVPYDIYRYTKISDGKVVGLIEARTFAAPDAEFFHSWVVDEVPTRDQADKIVAARNKVRVVDDRG